MTTTGDGWGLTDEEYEGLQDDIQQQIQKAMNIGVRVEIPESCNPNLDPVKEAPVPNPNPNIDPSRDLDPHTPDRDYAEYYIKGIKKTVRREDSFVRQVFYTALSKDSDDPLNLAVLATTSEGKTYGITQTLQYVPDKGLWYIGSMTPKVIV